MDSKKIKYSVLIIICVVIISLVALSYAYLAGQFESDVNSDVKVELSEQAEIVFTKGDDLNIAAGAHNMEENGDHLSSSTTVSVTLTAYGNFSSNYYIYFDILSNDFEYTTEEKTPELMLKIYKNGEEVKEASGLSYTESFGVEGYDVTVTSGVIEVGVPEVISLTDNEKEKTSITDEWEFVLYFINLDTNQYLNSGKTFESNVILDIEKYEILPLLSSIILMNEGEGYESVNLAKNYIESKEYIWGTAIDYDAGLYASIDQSGNNSYFFAGAVENNYVYFAGYYWRIIRIDGDGNIKLIYAGESQNSSGSGTEIGSYAFNASGIYLDSGTELRKSTIAVGFVYEDGLLRGNSTDSTIKSVLDDWYEINIESANLSDYVTETLYCIDRDSYSDFAENITLDAIITSAHYYGAYTRLIEHNVQPKITCNNPNDELSLNIGLISADEVAYANGSYNVNKDCYLTTLSSSWTITPGNYSYNYSNYAAVIQVNTLSNINISSVVSNKNGVRPTLSLVSTTKFESGDGSVTNPYKVS